MADSYTESLRQIADTIDNVYGLTDKEVVSSDDIVSVINGVDKYLASLAPQAILTKNNEVGKQIVLLSYLYKRLEYFQSVRLDYSLFPALDEIAKILQLFTEKKNFNKAIPQLNKIIKVLAEVDKTSVKARYGLGYRFLRAFIVLVMYKSSCNAAIVAEFILSQILVGVVE